MSLDKLNMDYSTTMQFDIINKALLELAKKIDDLFIYGLKRKGFEFESKIELENFIKSNCRCEDKVHLKQRTYFVNDTPFFLHCYNIEMDLNPKVNNTAITMSANYGSYTFL